MLQNWILSIPSVPPCFHYRGRHFLPAEEKISWHGTSCPGTKACGSLSYASSGGHTEMLDSKVFLGGSAEPLPLSSPCSYMHKPPLTAPGLRFLVQTPQASTGSRDWQGAQEAAGLLRMFHFLVWGWLHGHVQSTNIHGAGHLQGRHIIWRYVLFSTLHLRLKQKVKGTSRTHLCVECCGQVREASREAQFTPKWKGQRGKGAGWRPPEVRGESSDVRNNITHEKRQRSASP